MTPAAPVITTFTAWQCRAGACPDSLPTVRLPRPTDRTLHGEDQKGSDLASSPPCGVANCAQCAAPYFPSIIMLPSMSLSDRLGPKLSSRLLVSTRRPLLAPSVILPTRWV